MKLRCIIPCSCLEERKYILNWVLRDVLGLDIEIFSRPEQTLVEIADSEKSLRVADIFFPLTADNWLVAETLPSLPLLHVDTAGLIDAPSMVAIYCKKATQVEVNQQSVNIPIDLFGSLFFLISRYEEAVVPTRDNHNRFPSSASVLGKEGLLDRAIGNAYIELLWAAIQRLWPNLSRANRKFRLLLSHDIDVPATRWRSIGKAVTQSLAGVKASRPADVISTWANYAIHRYRTVTQQWERDPNDTITWILDQSDEQGVCSAFFYIPESSCAADPGMPIQHPHVQDQWKRIAKRGHEIGIHPGYETYDRPDRIQSGARAIRNQLCEMNIKQPELGGRQHVLRWAPQTAKFWDDAGLDYDSTLGYADHAGFRCGVCYEYPMYDIIDRKPLSLRQRPLVAMDCTVIDQRYMNLGHGSNAFDYFVSLKNEARKYNGDFALLWHNDRFRHASERELYVEVLKA